MASRTGLATCQAWLLLLWVWWNQHVLLLESALHEARHSRRYPVWVQSSQRVCGVSSWSRFPRAVLSGVVALLEDPDIGQAGPVAAEESGAPLLDQPVALGAPGIRGDHRPKLSRTLQERLTLIDHHDVRRSRRTGLRRETQRGQAHGG